MSLYLSSNKPRSPHRQPLTNTTPDSSIQGVEHSLGEWFSQTNNNYHQALSSETSTSSLGLYFNPTDHSSSPQLELVHPPPLLLSSSCSSPVTTLPSDQQHTSSCPCCQQSHCKAWRKMATSVQKLETETCLAAEIGQSLLRKNEDCTAESKQLKKKVQYYQERMHELETSLADSENLARQLNWEKEKWKRLCERMEKNLNQSIKDLETAHNKNNTLAKDLQQTNQTVEKLLLFKCKSQQHNTHEDVLNMKLEEIKGELAQSKKNENDLTRERKCLNMAYDTLSVAYKGLFAEYSMQKTNYRQIKPSSSASTSIITTSTPTLQHEMTTLIKKLQSENSSLQCELIHTLAQLDHAQNGTKDKYKSAFSSTRYNTLDINKLTINNGKKGHPVDISRWRALQHKDTNKHIISTSINNKQFHRSHPTSVRTPTLAATPRTTTSSPILPIHRPSATKDTNPPFRNITSPSLVNTTLLQQTRDILQRIRSTDMRILNRRLKRAFDIEQLSQMSNTILQNIMAEVDTMEGRFFWLAPDDDSNDDDGDDDDDKGPDVSSLSVDSLASLVQLLQELLQEIVQSTITINQLQLAYVKKVEKDDARVKQNHHEQSMEEVMSTTDHGNPGVMTTRHNTQLTVSPSNQCTMYLSGHNSISAIGTTNNKGTDNNNSTLANSSRNRRHTLQRTCHSSSSSNGHNDKKNSTFWTSLVDEWYLATMKNASSSLDRDWLLWNYSGDMSPKACW